jgi:hypothetical protein
MNDIRKIAVGPDYKGGAMHYVVGQEILKMPLKYGLNLHTTKKLFCGSSLLICLYLSNIILTSNEITLPIYHYSFRQ